MENKETILAKSDFDSSACHKFCLIFYLIMFIFGLQFLTIDVSIGFLVDILCTVFIGGIIHAVMYFSARNNCITLTNYKITGVYNRHLSLNIPIDSISSVSKGWQGSLCITCAGNKYNISFVGNRDDFCSSLNELLSKRTQQTMSEHSSKTSISSYEEIEKLKYLLDNGVISQEEFDAKKKQGLGL